MPPKLAEILKNSYWTILYQEQLMEMFVQLAGFSPQESDTARRAIGFYTFYIILKENKSPL
jgi:DNA polymerase III alpha subunit